mmetsp:Transcript_6453/g.17250  ORF Transcript_6453/g.17250 Transcript_6453/m.17250 type:complete len:221 (+) Transcript_6453:427-1089(+)
MLRCCRTWRSACAATATRKRRCFTTTCIQATCWPRPHRPTALIGNLQQWVPWALTWAACWASYCWHTLCSATSQLLKSSTVHINHLAPEIVGRQADLVSCLIPTQKAVLEVFLWREEHRMAGNLCKQLMVMDQRGNQVRGPTVGSSSVNGCWMLCVSCGACWTSNSNVSRKRWTPRKQLALEEASMLSSTQAVMAQDLLPCQHLQAARSGQTRLDLLRFA